MWNLIQELYRVVVYQPETNILYAFFRLTGDIGLSIILLATTVNLIIYPFFAKNYLGMQKTRILQPKIREIQAKYKKDPQKMIEEVRAFNKKHDISTGYTFLVLFIQIIIISGLFYVINDVVNGKEINTIYKIFFDTEIANFKDSDGKSLAFGFIDIGSPAINYIWIPFLSLVSSYLYGMYTFRWVKQPQLPIIKPKKKLKKDEQPILDPETMQKSLEFQSIYIMPIFLFVIQYNLPSGLNIYFAFSSILSLIRQIILTTYYSGHTKRLIKDVIDSDPTSRDNNPDNNLEIEADPAQLASDQEVATLVLKSKPKKSINSKKPKASKKRKAT